MADSDQPDSCGCLVSPSPALIPTRSLGLDSRLGEVELLACLDCGRRWLRYYYTLEGFTRSGRWYLGPLDDQQAAGLNVENARQAFEQMPWYFFGGSYYHGKTGKTSGPIQTGIA